MGDFGKTMTSTIENLGNLQNEHLASMPEKIVIPPIQILSSMSRASDAERINRSNANNAFYNKNNVRNLMKHKLLSSSSKKAKECLAMADSHKKIRNQHKRNSSEVNITESDKYNEFCINIIKSESETDEFPSQNLSFSNISKNVVENFNDNDNSDGLLMRNSGNAMNFKKNKLKGKKNQSMEKIAKNLKNVIYCDSHQQQQKSKYEDFDNNKEPTVITKTSDVDTKILLDTKGDTNDYLIEYSGGYK